MQEHLLQKAKSYCPLCNAEMLGFIIPDGRFICLLCAHPAVIARWEREWDPIQRELNRKQRVEERSRKISESLKHDIEKKECRLNELALQYEEKQKSPTFLNECKNRFYCMILLYVVAIVLILARQFALCSFGMLLLLFAIQNSLSLWNNRLGAHAFARSRCQHGTVGARQDPTSCAQCVLERQTMEQQELLKRKNDCERLAAEARLRKVESDRLATELAENTARAEWQEYHEYKSFDEVSRMSGLEFEKFVGRLFSKMGHLTELTPINDQGVDVICVAASGVRRAIQAKRWKGNVGNRAVQEIYSGMVCYDCTEGIIVTTSKFTTAAKRLAEKHKITLFDGQWLNAQIRQLIPKEIPEFNWNEYNKNVKNRIYNRPVSNVVTPIKAIENRSRRFRRHKRRRWR